MIWWLFDAPILLGGVHCGRPLAGVVRQLRGGPHQWGSRSDQWHARRLVPPAARRQRAARRRQPAKAGHAGDRRDRRRSPAPHQSHGVAERGDQLRVGQRRPALHGGEGVVPTKGRPWHS